VAEQNVAPSVAQECVIAPELIAVLRAMQLKYCWTVGSTVVGDFECSIWERAKWRDKERICLRGLGKSFNEAIIDGLDRLSKKDNILAQALPHLRTLSDKLTVNPISTTETSSQ